MATEQRRTATIDDSDIKLVKYRVVVICKRRTKGRLGEYQKNGEEDNVCFRQS